MPAESALNVAPAWKVVPLSLEYSSGAVPPDAVMVTDPVPPLLQARSAFVKVKVGPDGLVKVTEVVAVHVFASFIVTVKVPASTPVKFPEAWKVVPLME